MPPTTESNSVPEEVNNCRPFALTQLEILQPEFIVLLGAVAVRSVLQTDESVGRSARTLSSFSWRSSRRDLSPGLLIFARLSRKKLARERRANGHGRELKLI